MSNREDFFAAFRRHAEIVFPVFPVFPSQIRLMNQGDFR